jgi:hypothetical protein
MPTTVPQKYLCPYSGQPMQTVVQHACGQRFDFQTMHRHRNASHCVCCKEPIQISALKRDHALETEIQDYLINQAPRTRDMLKKYLEDHIIKLSMVDHMAANRAAMISSQRRQQFSTEFGQYKIHRSPYERVNPFQLFDQEQRLLKTVIAAEERQRLEKERAHVISKAVEQAFAERSERRLIAYGYRASIAKNQRSAVKTMKKLAPAIGSVVAYLRETPDFTKQDIQNDATMLPVFAEKEVKNIRKRTARINDLERKFKHYVFNGN